MFCTAKGNRRMLQSIEEHDVSIYADETLIETVSHMISTLVNMWRCLWNIQVSKKTPKVKILRRKILTSLSLTERKQYKAFFELN